MPRRTILLRLISLVWLSAVSEFLLESFSLILQTGGRKTKCDVPGITNNARSMAMSFLQLEHLFGNSVALFFAVHSLAQLQGKIERRCRTLTSDQVVRRDDRFT